MRLLGHFQYVILLLSDNKSIFCPQNVINRKIQASRKTINLSDFIPLHLMIILSASPKTKEIIFL